MKADYTFITGKIRVLENQILNATDIERMVDAPSLEAAFKVLNDTDYGDNLLEVAPTDYRLALADDNEQLYKLLKKLVKDRELLTLLFLDKDLVNIKLIFKSRIFGTNIAGLLKTNGLYQPELLQEYINQDHRHEYQDPYKKVALDKGIKKLLDNAKANLGPANTPAEVDTFLTQEYFALMVKLAKALRNPFIKRYVKILIDNANLITALRSQRLQLSPIALASKLIKGGTIDPAKLIFALNATNPKTFPKLLQDTYGKKITEAYSHFKQTQELFTIDRELEDYKTRYVALAKFITYGPEVVLAYYHAKRVAANNIRIIMTGKMNNIDSQEIKKTLRAIY